MDLPKEPIQPIPQATGAVPSHLRKWISVIVLGCFLFFTIIGWAISRWTEPSSKAMGPHAENKLAATDSKKSGASLLNEERERSYEKGKQEGQQSYFDLLNRINSSQHPPGQQSSSLASQQTSQSEKLTPEQEYKKLLHDAAMTDNMVAPRREERNGIQRIHSDGARDPVPSGTANDPLLAPIPGAPHNPDPLLLARGSDASKAATVILPRNALPEGTDIACTLVNQLNGDNTGPMKVQVSNDIPFPRIEEVAIPQGSLFLGEAQKVGGQFQERLAVSFHRLQIGQTAGQIRQINLKAPALSQDGSTALADQVNRHYVGIFGASLLIGAIGGLAQIGNSSYGGYGGIDAETQVRNGISQSMAQSSAQILNRFLNRMPTITIRPGHPVIVHLTDNLEIPN